MISFGAVPGMNGSTNSPLRIRPRKFGNRPRQHAADHAMNLEGLKHA